MGQALELIVLGAAPWPLYRLLSIRTVRIYYWCTALRTIAILITYAICIAGIAIYLPNFLHFAALLALIVLLYERWRSRDSYGRADRLPPGSLTLAPRAPRLDHRFYQKQFSLHGPVFKMNHFFWPMVCILGPGRGLELFRDHGDALSPRQIRHSRFIPRGFMCYMASGDHKIYKTLFQTAFRWTILENCYGSITQAVRSELAQMVEASARTNGKGIRLQPHLNRMLLEIFARTFFGIPQDSKDFTKLVDLYGKIDMRKLACGSSWHVIKVANEIAEIISKQSDIYQGLLDKNEEPPPCFLAEMVRSDPSASADPTILLNYVYMVRIGGNDLIGLLTWIVKLLSDNPEWSRRVRKEIDEQYSNEMADGSSLAGRIVKETLRLEQSEFLTRKVVDTIDFNGYVIPKGWLVRICIREGHRDPDIFDEAESFNPDRFSTRTYSATEYSPLGLLSHSCLAGQLVGTVSRAFIVNLIGGFDWTTTHDGPREFGRVHWQPSSAFRINVSPRASGNHSYSNMD